MTSKTPTQAPCQAGDTVYIRSGSRYLTTRPAKVVRVTPTGRVVTESSADYTTTFGPDGVEISSAPRYRRAELISKEEYDQHHERRRLEARRSNLNTKLSALGLSGRSKEDVLQYLATLVAEVTDLL